MNKFKTLIVYFLFFYNLVGCISINSEISNINKPIFYSDIKSSYTIPFEIDHTNFYYFSMEYESNKTIEQLIEIEILKHKDANGIKNLQIIIYNKTWLSYSIIPNPLGIISSSFILLGNVIGFSNKSIYIKGEIYFNEKK